MAPNKKYLSLEEAAVQLGLKVEELIRLREKGEVRGFADRGTWKFKADDVAEFRRRRQPDSDPDLPIMDDSDEDDLGRQATVIRQDAGAKSDSDVRLSMAGDPKKSKSSGTSGEMATIDMQKSDSDVRLFDPVSKSKKDSDSDVTLVKPKKGSETESDSDVKIIEPLGSEEDSDSDVKLLDPRSSLVDSDSDVRLTGTDSDVRLAPLVGSDSDVKLIGGKSKAGLSDSDSDVALLPKGSKGQSSRKKGSEAKGSTPGHIDFDLGGTDEEASVLDGDDSLISFPGDSGIRLGGDSGIQLASDSGIKLAGDSGIKLAGDSGIRLGGLSGIRLGGESGIRLADDSGVQLKHAADSGISLEGDSGIKLSEGSGLVLGGDSGINLMGASSSHLMKGGKGLKGSSKNQKAGGSGKLKGGSSKKLKGKTGADLDDVEATAAMPRRGRDEDDLDLTSPLLSASDVGSTSAAELDLFNPSDTSELESLGDSEHNVVMFEDDEDEAPPVQKQRKHKTVEESIFEIDDTSEEQLEELEVSDDDLSSDGEFEEGAFDDDAELDESFTTGASHVGIGAPQRVGAAPEMEWTAGVFTLVLTSMCFLIVGSIVSVDLLRTTWSQGADPGWVQALGGLWK